MGAFSFWYSRLVYTFILMALSAPLFWLASAAMDALDGTAALPLLRLVALLLLLGWFVGVSWLATRAASRRVTQGQDSWQALLGAFSDARFYLVFIPVIGRLFAPGRKG